MLKGLKQLNLPEIEERVLKFWKDNKIFEKSVANRRGKKNFVFFEGPPTANGRPGVHHAESRAFKDIILRYKTMRGYSVPRRAGWDTHGLPVEIEVEKELGLKNKQEIEKFGIAEFNAKAKASVWKYKAEWERFTERLGFWLDMKHPYVTYDNSYIESLWWVLAQIAKKGYLKKLYKVLPWCPRCQTPLSSHELAQPGAYKKTKDPSLFVKFKIQNSMSTSGQAKLKIKEFLLVWTTTPWTLPANVAVAVNPKLTYTKFKTGDEYLWSFNPPPKVDGKEPEMVEKISGKKLVGLEYEPLYKVLNNRNNQPSNFYKVIAANFVSTEEGTGLVHIAPAFGEDDLSVWQITNGKSQNEIPLTIDDRGFLQKRLPGAGKFIKDADKDIIADLGKRGLVHKTDTTEHDYPFCWRCSTPLIYFARSSWFIEMSRLRDRLLAENKKINWVPDHIKEGRFGDWLREIKDWAISRERYWGTPLPIWTHTPKLGNPKLADKNACNNYLVAGGLSDLDKHAYDKNSFFLIRHTEGEHNVHGIFAGGELEKKNNGPHLTKRGREQAEKIAKDLKKVKIDAIFCSPYRRTREVARIISKAASVKVIIDDRLSEISPGIFSGRPIKEYRNFFSNPLERFYKTPPGGENLTDVKKRMVTALENINQQFRGAKIAIISHGDPLWMLEAAMKNIANDRLDLVPYIDVGEYHKVDFHNWPYSNEAELDLHKPFIDKIYLKCPECGEKLSRIKEVADVWFDSGAMPFAQVHFPFDKRLEFPADYITEAIDQTRGWFYTLLAVAVALGKRHPYSNVICLGHVLDKNGQKMSKSKGNTVDPISMMEKYGADVLRWYFFTINPPGEPKKFDEADLAKMFRKLFLLLYNSFVFYETYAPIAGKPLKVLDQWILARLEETNHQAAKSLDNYDVGGAGRLIENFIDDLSRWYIRRSRKNVSPKTLHTVLLTLSRLLAPFTPFFSEALYQSLRGPNRQKADFADSVHLTDWPMADSKFKISAFALRTTAGKPTSAKASADKQDSKKILEAMAEVRRLASLALAEREKAKIKVRQPLRELRIKNKELSKDEELLVLLKDEVNVKEIIFDSKIKGELELDTRITPELRSEGVIRELTRLVQGLRHDAGYHPGNRINVAVEAPTELLDIIESRLSQFKKEVKAKEIMFKRVKKFDAEQNTKIEQWPVWLAVNKIR